MTEHDDGLAAGVRIVAGELGGSAARDNGAIAAPASVPVDPADPIVGVWRVHASMAPFPWHLFAFHADGVAVQTNPQRPDSPYIDSLGLGHWHREPGGDVEVRLSEIRARRTDGAFAGTGEITMRVKVDGSHFTGQAETAWIDAEGQQSAGPTTALVGERLAGSTSAQRL